MKARSTPALFSPVTVKWVIAILLYDGNLNSSFLLIIHNSFQPKEKEILFDLLYSLISVLQRSQNWIRNTFLRLPVCETVILSTS